MLTFNLEDMIDRLEAGQWLKEPEIEWLCRRIQEVLVDEGNVVSVPAPVTVVGSVMG